MDAASERRRLAVTFWIEGILSFAANLIFIGVFFYAQKVYGWGTTANFTLASGMGLVYIAGSLASQKLAERMGARRLLIWANAGLAAVSLGAALFQSQGAMIGLTLAYVPLTALNWPVLESQAAIRADAHTMSRRIGAYNLVWSGTGALAIALQGAMMLISPRTVFIAPLLIHGAILVILGTNRQYCAQGHDHATRLDAEPELASQRKLAMWLSRITLPSTYVVIYSLSAALPALPLVKELSTQAATAVCSAWMAARFLIFWILGATRFWHTRPRLLLLAAATMLGGFLGTTLRLSDVLGTPPQWDLAAMLVCQATLGAALGWIYTASLYFGLVRSEGSTEHAGYHEALIGLGQVLGPGAGALMSLAWPRSGSAGVLAVGAIVCASVGAAVLVAASVRSAGAAAGKSGNPA